MRDQRGVGRLEDFAADCRHGVRLLRGSPVFTLVALLSLALGIGANTAILRLIDTIMLRSMSVTEPDRLVEFMRAIPRCLAYSRLNGTAFTIVGVTPKLFLGPIVGGPPEVAITGCR